MKKNDKKLLTKINSHHHSRFLLLLIIGVIFLFQGSPCFAKHWDNGKLIISPNGRYLMHENNVPFFWFGDTAWCIFHRANMSEANQYLSDRQSKGFTVIQASVLGVGRIQGITEPAHNLVNGELPFFNQDPTTPNEAFFQHVDAIIDEAANKNLYVGLLPTWGEYVCPAWHDGPKIFNETKARIYGEWIGNRYKDRPNVIWILGGDRAGNYCGAGDLAIWRAMANGIKSADSNHLITYHYTAHGGVSEYDLFHNDSWLGFNMIESYKHADWIYTGIKTSYNLTPTKPVVNGESAYYNRQTPIVEDGTGCTQYKTLPERHYRSQPYWITLAGGTGYTFGQEFIWVFEKSTDGNDMSTTNKCDYDVDWYNYLDTDGTIWAVYWKDFFQSMDWWNLIPDQSIIMTNERSGTDRKVAARLLDGSGIIVYYATRETAQIDMEKITSSSEAQAKWWNPVDKSESVIGTFPASGTQLFTPPSGWDDALLVLKAVESAPTCINQGHNCCNSCESGIEDYPNLSGTCHSEQVCCDICSASSPDSIIGYWTMDSTDISGTTIFDKSGNSNDGTIYGAISAEGKIAQALNFDGNDDYIEIPDDGSLDFGTSDFSLMAWVKRDSSGIRDTIIDKEESGGNGYQWFIHETDDKPRFRIDAGSGVAGSANTAITDTNWHYLGVTVDRSGNANFYLDGNPDGTLGVSSQSGDISSGVSLGIGADVTAVTNEMKGLIDEVTMYNYALNPGEILELYFSGSDTVSPSRSNPQPTGTLSSGTTSTIISLDTDETAICKYSRIIETNYDLMENTFTNTNSTNHSTDVTDLSDGNSYTYYVRCQDESGNQNPDDFEISFSIASHTTYGIANFIALVSDWLKSEPDLTSDVNNDGVVNTRDLGIMMSNWK